MQTFDFFLNQAVSMELSIKTEKKESSKKDYLTQLNLSCRWQDELAASRSEGTHAHSLTWIKCVDGDHKAQQSSLKFTVNAKTWSVKTQIMCYKTFLATCSRCISTRAWFWNRSWDLWGLLLANIKHIYCIIKAVWAKFHVYWAPCMIFCWLCTRVKNQCTLPVRFQQRSGAAPPSTPNLPLSRWKRSTRLLGLISSLRSLAGWPQPGDMWVCLATCWLTVPPPCTPAWVSLTGKRRLPSSADSPDRNNEKKNATYISPVFSREESTLLHCEVSQIFIGRQRNTVDWQVNRQYVCICIYTWMLR